MIILAVDSTAVTAAAALCHDDAVIAQYTVNGAKTHSETLLPMAASLLRSAKLTTADVGLFAVSAGPGSFTGVRIGVSLIKGLAFNSGKPCAAVSSLEALACNLEGMGGIVCPVMDARRGQFYNALFRNGIRLTPDRLITAEELTRELAGYEEPIFFVGDGYEPARRLIALPNLMETPPLLRRQNACSVARCAWKQYQRGEGIFTDASLSPVYLRASQAEREREEAERAAREQVPARTEF